MNLSKDIEEKISSDFPKDIELIKSLLSEIDTQENERVMRGILYLANGDFEIFDRYYKMAKIDYRDLIMNSEYEYPSHKRVRDFSKSL